MLGIGVTGEHNARKQMNANTEAELSELEQQGR
jgi:hypothetical protein